MREIAREWEDVANLTLQFVTSGTAEIRISFAEQGFSWSTVGTDALTVPRAEPTMNYGWLEPDTELTEYQRVVRHEFGHALGMIHEHQNPDALGKIPWDKPKVYEYYARQGWSRADVDANLFDVYDEDSTNFTTFDPTSIMQYAIPEELTIGTYSVGWNTELSATDIAFMQAQYPATDSATVDARRRGRGDAAAIGGGEVDTFHFDVPDRRHVHRHDDRRPRHRADAARAGRPGHRRGVGRRPRSGAQRAHRAPARAGLVLAHGPPQVARQAYRRVRGAGHPPRELTGGTVARAWASSAVRFRSTPPRSSA